MADKKKNILANHDPVPGKPAALFHLASAFVLTCFCFIIYANALRVPFLFDDQLNITDNPYIRVTGLSLSQLKRAAIQDRFQLRFLSNLSFGLDYYFHGLNRGVMHAENVALHALAAVALYFIVYNLVPLAARAPSPEKKRRWAALIAALAWAAHPAHTQAVTYLVQRQTGLAVAAMLISFLAFIKAREATRPRRRQALYALAVLAFLVAAGSKEIGWTTPAYWVLFELLIRPRQKSGKKERYSLVWVSAVLVFSLMAVLMVLAETGILSSYWKSYQVLGYGPVDRMLTEPRVICSYLGTIFFPDPARLALDHEVAVSRSLLSPATTLPAILFLALALALAVRSWKVFPLLPFLVLGFLVALAPESSFIPVELMNDHRIYLSSLFVIPALAAAPVLGLDLRRCLPFIALIIIMLGSLTASRNRSWESALRIWGDSVKKSPGLARPWTNYCGALVEAHDPSGAINACDHALALDPGQVMAVVNKCIALMTLGREEEAGASFAAAARMKPPNAAALYNYGVFLEKKGEADKALEQYDRAIVVAPLHLMALFRRASLLRKQGRLDEAREGLALVTRMYPSFQPAWIELGFAALDRCDFNEARRALAAAQKYGGESPELARLGEAFKEYGKTCGP